MNRFYLTTPIYYINGKPSIGHAYTTIAADVLARYHRAKGERVFFLTGTDENSQKNTEAAMQAGMEIQPYLDQMAMVWKKTFDEMGISYDRFIRTTEPDHHSAVAKFWKLVQKKGDIYQSTYTGLYCKGCEAFVTQSDLIDGVCPHHKGEPEKIEEQNYFFRLSAYRDALLQHIDAHPEFIQPIGRKNEVRSYIESFMEDVSISRSSVKWGIPVPGDESQRIYVWFDALVNYITGIGFGSNVETFETFWPADLHLVGKDIIKFHCAIWPAMLMSAGLPLPKRVFAHGFFTVDGQKMSKSLGNVVDPLVLKKEWGNDAIRYYVLRDISFGEDGDFSHERLKSRYETELGNELGNLVHRVISMAIKYGVHPPSYEMTFDDTSIHRAIEDLRFHDALDGIWTIVRLGNQTIEMTKPWVLAKEGKKDELHAFLQNQLHTIHRLACLLNPFMPDTAERMYKKIGENGTLELGEPLFPRKEYAHS